MHVLLFNYTHHLTIPPSHHLSSHPSQHSSELYIHRLINPSHPYHPITRSSHVCIALLLSVWINSALFIELLVWSCCDGWLRWVGGLVGWFGWEEGRGEIGDWGDRGLGSGGVDGLCTKSSYHLGIPLFIIPSFSTLFSRNLFIDLPLSCLQQFYQIIVLFFTSRSTIFQVDW